MENAYKSKESAQESVGLAAELIHVIVVKLTPNDDLDLRTLIACSLRVVSRACLYSSRSILFKEVYLSQQLQPFCLRERYGIKIYSFSPYSLPLDLIDNESIELLILSLVFTSILLWLFSIFFCHRQYLKPKSADVITGRHELFPILNFTTSDLSFSILAPFGFYINCK
jgi:hypothetical protein